MIDLNYAMVATFLLGPAEQAAPGQPTGCKLGYVNPMPQGHVYAIHRCVLIYWIRRLSYIILDYNRF